MHMFSEKMIGLLSWNTVSFQVAFEGVVGRSFTGDIAIDDITLRNGPCPSPGSCDFESGFCSWTNDHGNDQFDWIRHKGRTASVGTGPSTDHTLGTTQGKSFI